MEDITRRLRLSKEPDSVDRERYMAANIFGDYIREHNDQIMTIHQVRTYARLSIDAACVFWEEWDIASLTPDMEAEPSDSAKNSVALLRHSEGWMQGLA